MDVNFFLPTKLRMGRGVVKKNGARIFSRMGKRCAIITGKNSAAVCGALDDVIFALKEAKIEYIHLDGIQPNPLLSTAYEYGKRARAFGADFIVGVGGGSPMDAAKAVAFYAANELEMMEAYEPGKTKKPALPIVCIPTTAGTGSEVTPYAVMSLKDPDKKQTVSGRDLFPKYALVDPAYTENLPTDITVSTGLDALAHAVESCFLKKADAFSRLFSERAAGLIWPVLSRAAQGTLTARQREELMEGSVLAGMAIAQTGTAFPHPAGYPLTVNHGLPHGLACACFMPDMLRHQATEKGEMVNRLLGLMGLDSLGEFEKKLGEIAPVTLSLTEAQARAYALEASQASGCDRMLVPIDAQQLTGVYLRLFTR